MSREQKMRKRFIFGAACFISAAVFFDGCASNKVEPASLSPAAVVSVTGTELVNWLISQSDSSEDDDDGNSYVNGTINKLLDSKNPEIQTAVDRLDYADETLRHMAGEFTDIEILDKDEVINSSAYKNLRKSLYNALQSTATATGYKDLTVINSKIARMFMQQLGASSLIMLDFSFGKDISSGSRRNGLAEAVVTMKAKIIGRDGKETVNKEYTAVSSKKVPVQYDQYDKNEMVERIQETIDDVIKEFVLEKLCAGHSAVNTESTEFIQKSGSTLDNAENSDAQPVVAPTKLGKPKKQEMTKEENIASEKSPEEIARTLLDMGLDSTKVSEATGLSVEKILEIQKGDSENADAAEKE